MSTSKYILKSFIIMTFITLVSLRPILDTAPLFSNSNDFSVKANLAYGQLDHTTSNITNSLNIHNMSIKKIHVEDIDIAYKVFGKGDPILLITGLACMYTDPITY